MFNKKISAFGLTSAILFSAASAFAAENQAEVVTQQKSLLEKLDSLNAAVLGLKINGTAKAGALASFASSDQYANESPTQENQAFTDVNLRLTARPSSETMIDVQLRLHKDWQSAYDENNNPIIGHWFSYDGTILNKHVDFNLGYMRVGYTPLTIYTPQTEILQEPEIFAEKRREALAQRNLDTTSRRLFQGLNVAYQSGNVGPVDNITAQLTGARLRNTAKKLDQVFFDFDFADRYLIGARVGADAYGAHLGVNFVNSFDRKLPSRSKKIAETDTVYYDKDIVFSGELGFDSKKLLPDLPFTFGFNGEFAMSKWTVDRDYMTSSVSSKYLLTSKKIDGKEIVYIQTKTDYPSVRTNQDYRDQDGKSIYANLFVKGSVSGLDFNAEAAYLQTDSSFWSEQASSPVYQGRSVILNATSFYNNPLNTAIMATFGASSLENLYYNVYNSTTLQATNLMTSENLANALSNENESANLFARLDNNYKNGHFYRNGYTGNTVKKLEAEKDYLRDLDPSVSLSLPFGLATPDRKGIMAKVDANWDDKLFFNGRVSMLTQMYADYGKWLGAGVPVIEENKFTEFAFGVGADIGIFAGLDRQILVQGSFSQASESAYLKRQATRIVAGLTADIWGPISLLAGFQQYKLVFDRGGVPFVGGTEEAAFTFNVNESSERLIMAGLRVKLATMSYLSLQYGMLTNELKYAYNVAGVPGADKLSITKNIISADVTVNF